MAIAPVLKTGVRKDLGVRIPRPPLGISQTASGVLVMLALLAPLSPALAASNDTTRVQLWIGIGPGAARGTSALASGALGAVYRPWAVRFSVGMSDGDPWSEFQEYAALYGKTYRSRRHSVSVRAGISLIRWSRFSYSLFDESIVLSSDIEPGLPLESQANWHLTRRFALTITAIGNVNRLRHCGSLLGGASFHLR